jgi:coproporphyrinogen III oxidase
LKKTKPLLVRSPNTPRLVIHRELSQDRLGSAPPVDPISTDDDDKETAPLFTLIKMNTLARAPSAAAAAGPMMPRTRLSAPTTRAMAIHRARPTTAAIIARAAAPAATAPSTAHGAAAHLPAPQGHDDFAAFEQFIVASQDRILREAEVLDGSGRTFLRDRWERPGGDKGEGYGVTAVLEGGDLLEKAAANITVIQGTLSPQRAQAMSSRGRGNVDPKGGQRYGAAALSLVFHPRHPRVPTLRADVRLFQVFSSSESSSSSSPPLSWYGGGCDLTPALLFEQDAKEFHAHWKEVCAAHHPSLYKELKPWCDRYFYVTARREHRGVGGIFYDDLERRAGDGGEAADNDDADTTKAGEGAPLSMAAARAGEYDPAAFSRDVLANVLPSWTEIANRRRQEPYSEEERKWQLQRRGRYLEFNLLDDRGVKFGLADGSGRVESIMVSAPPLIAWSYNVVPPEGSREAATLELLRGTPREWV